MRISQNCTVKDATSLWGVLMRCPCCKTDIPAQDCTVCGFKMRPDNGIINALPLERAAHYAQFMQDYARIREAEGRGSESSDFYLNLPYKDITEKNTTQWHIRARSYDYLAAHVLKRIFKGQSARILDVGAGNCWMSFRLALAGYQPVALDLLANDRDGLGAAAHYEYYLNKSLPRFQAEASCLPFQDEQFDAIIFNASFHYSENYTVTLGEALRCVRSGGVVIVSDTPWYSCEESGRRMVAERHAAFARHYGTASNSIQSLEYLTDERLRAMEEHFSIKWNMYSPYYGLKWAMRPLVAKLRKKREPSQFRIYVAQKEA